MNILQTKWAPTHFQDILTCFERLSREKRESPQLYTAPVCEIIRTKNGKLTLREWGTRFKLFSAIVEQKSVNGLNWLKKILAANPGLLEGDSDKESVENFEDRIGAEIEKLPSAGATRDSYQLLIAEISALLGIKPQKTDLAKNANA